MSNATVLAAYNDLKKAWKAENLEATAKLLDSLKVNDIAEQQCNYYK